MSSKQSSALSIIIPALNEASSISKTIECLLAQVDLTDEIIVVDGGSSDATIELAKETGVAVLQSARGRAVQMNAGAAGASSDFLLFLHADTVLPDNGVPLVKAALEKHRAGRFRLAFDKKTLSLAFYASYTRFHCFSYGDQGFFMRRDVFNELNGFDENVPFEDLDFYARLRKICRPLILKKSVITSARRFEEVGAWKQKWINILLVTLYYAGFDIEGLKRRLYKDVR